MFGAVFVTFVEFAAILLVDGKECNCYEIFLMMFWFT